MNPYLSDWRNAVWSLGIALTAVLVALLAHYALFWFIKRIARRKEGIWNDLLIRYCEKPTRLLLPLLALLAVLPWLPLGALRDPISHAVGLAVIAAFTWLALAMLNAVQHLIAVRHSMATEDNLAARRLQTQVGVLRQIGGIVIVVLAIAIMLMTFPSIRHLGESLFASAGLAALVAGLAARTTLTNLIAGVEIALTQPIRLEDAVVVEGEWGWIEEITTTYVVVRIWDLRRLVLPLTYFIEKPFQNWTFRTADLLGTVFFYTDYTVPVDEVRSELHRILERSGMWDGKTWGLQVTNTSDRVMELRALMSAPGSSRLWDLRCHVREKLLGFLQQTYPGCLPKTRAELATFGINRDQLQEQREEGAA